MKVYQAVDEPIIAREGLLRLVAVIERLQARASDQAEASSWTTEGAAAPDTGPEAGGRSCVGGTAAGEPAGRAVLAGGAGRPDASGGHDSRGRGPGRPEG